MARVTAATRWPAPVWRPSAAAATPWDAAIVIPIEPQGVTGASDPRADGAARGW